MTMRKQKLKTMRVKTNGRMDGRPRDIMLPYACEPNLQGRASQCHPTVWTKRRVNQKMVVAPIQVTQRRSHPMKMWGYLRCQPSAEERAWLPTSELLLLLLLLLLALWFPTLSHGRIPKQRISIDFSFLKCFLWF